MIQSVLIFVLVAITFFSCGQKKQSVDSIDSISLTYPETILPQDTTKLWVSEGDSAKEIITIFLQGGPKDELSFVTRGKTSWRYLPNFNDYYRVHLHQANTLNTDIFRYTGEFTMKMARKEVDNTSEILYRAIKYFKDRNKTVYVMGHSYGAFVIPHYLATRPSLADKYVIASGRIDDPKNAVAAHEKGFNGLYQDGTIFISDEGTEDSEAATKYYKVKQLLKAAIGEISYSMALTDVDFTNSIYIYNAKDERVGGLTQPELDFLKSKGFQIYRTEHEHSDTVYGLVDAIREGKVKL